MRFALPIIPEAHVLTEEAIAQALATVTGWLDRIFSPLVTLWVFLGQVLSAEKVRIPPTTMAC
jgi:hypothetical protein